MKKSWDRGVVAAGGKWREGMALTCRCITTCKLPSVESCFVPGGGMDLGWYGSLELTQYDLSVVSSCVAKLSDGQKNHLWQGKTFMDAGETLAMYLP